MRMRRWKLALFLCSTVGAIGCGATGGHNLPPAAQLAHPGPGVGGPGPGVLTPPMPPMGAGGPSSFAVQGPGPGQPMFAGHPGQGMPPGGPGMPGGRGMPGGPGMPPGGMPPGSMVAPASYHGHGHHVAQYGGEYIEGGYAGEYVEGGEECVDEGGGAAVQDVQVMFGRPEGMQVFWDISGSGQFDSTPLVTPGRQNFQQGSIYRLKLTNIPGAGREGVELYPTLEIGPPARRTLAYLAHNAIPIQLTEEDFDQVLAGNFVTKVIYLPDPEFQGLAVADVATLVSTRLEPGLDPIEEASRKGAILAILRVGNKDIEIPGVDMSGHVMPASFVSAIGGSNCGPAGCGAGGGGCCGPNGCGLKGILGRHGGAGCQVGGYSPATMSMGPGGMPPGLLTGMGTPQYGMPMSGTPIGLPGPPHIPLGVPAGLQKHVIKNRTKMHIPDPVCDVKVSVKQRPGQSYPHPVSRVRITEDTIHPNVHFHHGPKSTGQIQHACGHCGGHGCLRCR